MRPLLVLCALTQECKLNAVLECALLDQAAVRDVRVRLAHAHGEAKVDHRIRIELSGTELDDVAETFGLAVFAGHCLVFVGVAVESDGVTVSRDRAGRGNGAPELEMKGCIRGTEVLTGLCMIT